MSIRSLLPMTAAISVASIAGAQAPETDYEGLFEGAVAAIDRDFDRDWAFTETSLADGLLWVARFDPRRPGDARWTVLSVDGRAPTEDEIEDFVDEKNTEAIVENFTGDIDDMVRPGSLQLIDDADDHWLLGFVPDEDDADFAEHVEGRMRISKAGRHLEFVEMASRETVNAGLGTRIDNFLTRFTFAPAVEGGPIVPRTIEVRIEGRALFFIGFDETEIVRYSDFEQASGN